MWEEGIEIMLITCLYCPAQYQHVPALQQAILLLTSYWSSLILANVKALCLPVSSIIWSEANMYNTFLVGLNVGLFPITNVTVVLSVHYTITDQKIDSSACISQVQPEHVDYMNKSI